MENHEHLLALKVMRLTRPTLVSSNNFISCEPRDLPQNTFQKTDDTEFLSGQFMLLPQSFGSIYLGETFASYICVHNCTSHPVEGVTIKADLQSNTTRVNLPMNENIGPQTLNQDDTLDDVIRYEVREVGTHIMICEVNYTTPAGLPQYFRKFFKFQVLKPLDVKTKFYNAKMYEIFLEAYILNETSNSFCLEKVELVPSEQYTVTPLNTLSNGESVFSSKNMLAPNNSCQFIYCVKPNPDIAKDIKLLQVSNAVGRLDIIWRSNLGEKGRLQTSMLQRMPFEYKDLHLEVIDAKNIVKIGEPFTFLCRLTNTTSSPMDLRIKLESNQTWGCSYTGACEIGLGHLGASESRDFPITIFPTRLGLIQISPLIITNIAQQKQYFIDEIVEVFVVDSDNPEEDKFQMSQFVRYDNNTQNVKQESLQLQIV